MANRAENLMRSMSNALLQLRPLGGSEMFVRYEGDEYVADPTYCSKLIIEMRDNLRDMRIENADLRAAARLQASEAEA